MAATTGMRLKAATAALALIGLLAGSGPVAALSDEPAVLARPGAGPVAAPAAASIDTTPPTLSNVRAYFSPVGQLTGTAAPMWVLWSADFAGGSDIVYEEVWQSVNSGPYQRVWVTGDGGPATVLAPTHGSFRLRVRATDAAGNVSAWAYSATYQAVLRQTSSGVAYSGTWHSAISSGFSGGSTRYSTVHGATALFTFTGRSIALVATRGLAYGQMRVFVDGWTNYTTVDCGGSARQFRQIVWAKTWSTSRQHTIRVFVRGTAGHPRVDIDAFAVLR